MTHSCLLLIRAELCRTSRPFAELRDRLHRRAADSPTPSLPPSPPPSLSPSLPPARDAIL